MHYITRYYYEATISNRLAEVEAYPARAGANGSLPGFLGMLSHCFRVVIFKLRKGDLRMARPTIAEYLGTLTAEYQLAKTPKPWWFDRLVRRIVYRGNT